MCLACLILGPAAGRADDWQPLFNGKDLTGRRANFDPDSFQVADGVLRIQASGKTSAHLVYVGDLREGIETFKDFELEATVRAEPDSNGGIFVHTVGTTWDADKHLAMGYEVQLNSSAEEKRKTGSLYAIADLAALPVDETRWFTVRVADHDKRITIAIDGQPVVDYTEPADVRRPPERAGRRLEEDGGAIALQAHDAKSVWYFKDIRVRKRTRMDAMPALPRPTPEELEGMLSRSLDEAYAGWNGVQRAIYLAVWRAPRLRSDIGRYLGLPADAVARAMEDGMFGDLLWDRTQPDPYVNVK